MLRRDLLRLIAAAGAASLAPAVAASADPKAVALRIRRLAWAGVLVEAGDVALFVDAVAPEPDEGAPADLLDTGAPQRVALVTHAHNDHFDADALASVLGERGTLVVEASVAKWIEHRGLRLRIADLWQPVLLPRVGSDIVVFAVPAVDGFGAGPQVSWVIDAGGRRLFHGGDTQWHGGWADIGRAYGPFDAAFLPINGARMNRGRFEDRGIPAVLTPEQAVEAARALRARRLVPIHYGQPDPPGYLEVDRPLERLRAAARSAGVEVMELAVGARWTP